MRTFLYLHCSDLELARSFYSGVLNLVEIFHSAEEGTVGYQAGDLQVTIAVHPHPVRVEEFARQLGWEGGSSPMPSWGFECSPADFSRSVDAARVAGADTFHSEPKWVGYWSFPVRDPMGNTVEISTPQRDAWRPSD